MIKAISRTSLFLVLLTGLSLAKENLGASKSYEKGLRISAACAPPTSSVELDVNNVRALLHNGGDMWWDLVSNPRYEVPKVDNPADRRFSSFAASLWIGGIDGGGQLRVAAQTYRQSGYDFWPGPLTSGGANIDDATCKKWDRHYKITSQEIASFRADYADNGVVDNPEDYPNVINWPAKGEDMDGNTIFLAPFVDVDGDPLNYSPAAGDYPDIFGDQAIWWVVNDKGNVHTETGGQPIGLEIQMLAFAFTTSNDINNMTFYKYKVINRSALVLNETYMGQWVDADLGNYADDYVGCDTTLGLGYCYNGDADDEGSTGYGLEPPAFGTDFFQGPIADPDGIDNDKDGLTDEPNERIGMAKFVYYNNDFSLTGNPEVASHFYGYLRGLWKDGSCMVDNGTNGYGGGTCTNYMFYGRPGPSTGCGNTGWTETTAGNTPADRRYLQSAGPFTLQPGAVNDIVVGALWTRNLGSGLDQFGAVCKMLEADQLAQALFDNNFKLLDGPDAPTVTITELDKELIIDWGYTENDKSVKNNYAEGYIQADPLLRATGVVDSLVRFEGYLVYQLADNTVSQNELTDPGRARLIAQCDIKNGVETIIDRTTTTIGGITVIVDEVMVQGENKGIYNTLRVTEDQFATGTDKSLKNYTTYYYAVIAYGYNGSSLDEKRFVPSRRFFGVTTGLPHKVNLDINGYEINSTYSNEPDITMIAGIGNGANYLELTQPTLDQILATDSVANITYKAGYAPIKVKVVNPKEVKASDYRVEYVKKLFVGPVDTVFYDTVTFSPMRLIADSTFTEWILYEKQGASYVEIYRNTFKRRLVTDGVTSTIYDLPEEYSGRERSIPGHGISVTIADAKFNAGDTLAPDEGYETGFIGSTVSYTDNTRQWLAGVEQIDSRSNNGDDSYDWILAGSTGVNTFEGDRGKKVHRQNHMFDEVDTWEKIVSGYWAPFCLARRFNNNDGSISPGIAVQPSPYVTAPSETISLGRLVNLDELMDVDIVITRDKSKWSKCLVIETGQQSLGSGAFPMTARWDKSVDQDGNVIDAINPLSTTNQGYSYFPGYAIDVNTGRRLNIMFGENSFDVSNNGRDMIWNPTSSYGNDGQRVGGRHYVWVLNTTYDGCQQYQTNACVGVQTAPTNPSRLDWGAAGNTKKLWEDVAWVGTPMTSSTIYNFDKPENMPCDVRVAIRTKRRFVSRAGTTDYPIFDFNMSSFATGVPTTDEMKKDLMELVNVVPNPYYAISRYESSQIQTIVKFTNLPKKCTIRIFTLNGTLIRQYDKDSDSPEQLWDLKNQDGVPIASGMYIIHVDAGDLGEKVLKWFGVMPQLDLNSF